MGQSYSLGYWQSIIVKSTLLYQWWWDTKWPELCTTIYHLLSFWCKGRLDYVFQQSVDEKQLSSTRHALHCLLGDMFNPLLEDLNLPNMTWLWVNSCVTDVTECERSSYNVHFYNLNFFRFLQLNTANSFYQIIYIIQILVCNILLMLLRWQKCPLSMEWPCDTNTKCAVVFVLHSNSKSSLFYFLFHVYRSLELTYKYGNLSKGACKPGFAAAKMSAIYPK